MVYKSIFPDTEYIKNETIFELIFGGGNGVENNKVVYFDGEDPTVHLSFGEMKTKILKGASGLQKELGFKKGDVLAICSPNCIDYAIILHSAIQAGGAVACIDERFKPKVMSKDLDVVSPKILVTHRDVLDNALAAAKIHGIPESNILVFGNEDIGSVRSLDKTIFNGNSLATPYKFTPYELANDPCCLLFTSGTGGIRKSVVVTQNMLYISTTTTNLKHMSDKKALSYTRFHHISGIISTMFVFPVYGIQSYIVRDQSLENIFRSVEKHKINFFTTQPFVISALAKDDSVVKRYDISSLCFAICVGSNLNGEIARVAMEKYNMKVLNLYGMTEVLGAFKSEPEITKLGGVGRLAANYTVKIIDENGNEVPPGEVGEVCIHGPSITPGYYGNPEATNAAIDSEGYYHTGDLLRCDENGIFYYVDRQSDLFKAKNTYICPTSIETVVNSHPSVSESAVVAIYSLEECTNHPRAYIRLMDGVEHSENVEQEILEYANSRLEDFQQLHAGVVIVEDFPKTAVGKIQRRLICQFYNTTPA